jgi:hypothetical protein
MYTPTCEECQELETFSYQLLDPRPPRGGTQYARYRSWMKQKAGCTVKPEHEVEMCRTLNGCG